MDLFHTQARADTRNPVMRPEFTEDGSARLVLIYEWDRTKPMAAWMMNNPSIAGRDGGGGEGEATFDPTARRVIHFSDMVGAGSCALLNWCPLVETKPADLWRRISAGAFPRDLEVRNNATIAGIAGKALHLFVATGPEGLRRDPPRFRCAVDVFTGGKALHCLGTTEEGAPLHPLARGRYAIPNDRRPVPFSLRDWKGYDA